MSGFYLIHRGSMSHPVFHGEEYSRWQAWCWLIENAVFKDGRVPAGGRWMDLKRGQLTYSFRFMAKAWRWDDAKVRRFIKRIQAEKMIECVTDAAQNVITICNYDKYQTVERVTDSHIAASPTQDRRVTDANNNEGNEGNEVKGGEPPALPAPKVEPKPKKKKPFALPDDWDLSAEKRARAVQEHPSLDVDQQILKFKAYHKHVGRLGLDWDMAFMVTWLLRAEDIAQNERQRIPAFLDRNKPGPGKIAIQDSSPEAAATAKKAREWDERKAHLVREARYGKDREGAKTELQSMGFDGEGKPLRKEVAA